MRQNKISDPTGTRKNPKRSLKAIEKRASEASGKHRKPRSTRPTKLTRLEKAPRRRSLALLRGLRAGEGSYSKLLRDYHLDTRTAHKHLGKALRVGAGHRVHATKSDRLVRELLFPSFSGDVLRRIRGSKAASQLSEFFRDRGKLLGHKLSAQDFESKWRDVRIAGQEVFADAATIFLRADFGDLKIDELYGSVGGEE
jgi:hypothetical protein